MDNRYHKYNCPALMSDGRFISNYTRSSVFDQYIRKENNIKSSHEFRHFLQDHGTTILNNLKAYHRENNTCSVEGRCLPMSGQNNENIMRDTRKQLIDTVDNWFNNLVEENSEELNFMMTMHNEKPENPENNNKEEQRVPMPEQTIKTDEPRKCNFCKV